MAPQDVITISAGGSILEAARRMREHAVGCLIVTDDKAKVTGIITERDVVGFLAAGSADAKDEHVRQAMTSKLAVCPPGTSLQQASEIMARQGVRHLPIVENGSAQGIISIRDTLAEQIDRHRAMQAAAERVAMLATNLKALDFAEVISMVTSQVPTIFQAPRCMLCLPSSAGSSSAAPLDVRHNCPCPDRDLPGPADLAAVDEKSVTFLEQTPGPCQARGGCPPAVRIPLQVAGREKLEGREPADRAGYMCMCGLDRASRYSKDLVCYTGCLVREILNANLTSARVYEEAKRRSDTDTLTGVATRRVFEEELKTECARASRYGNALSVAIVDLDHFKRVNDKLGHAAGDRALALMGRCMRGQKRDSDVLARYGGDEFVLLMPETAPEDGVRVCERIRLSISQVQTSDEMVLTASCGVAGRSAGAKEPLGELVRRADMALYEAKRNGRNRTLMWEGPFSENDYRQHLVTPRVAELEVRVAELSKDSKDIFVQSIWGLVRALEARDPYTKNHSDNVMRYAVGVAETMSFSAEEVNVIRRGAMIHDIGKIGVPDAILRKPGRLEHAERRIMEQHPLISVSILDQMRFLEREMPIVRNHHERWDGKGYPDALAGKAIPRMARVAAVADAFDAITSDRVYRTSRSLDEAMAVLIAESGVQFDPEVVEATITWIGSVRSSLQHPEKCTVQDLLDSQQSCSVAA